MHYPPLLTTATAICCLVLLTTTTNAQLTGVGTTTPQSKFDVVASNPNAPDSRDGILVPRVNQFPVVNPGAAQNGMLVFLNVAAGNKNPGSIIH